MSHTYPDGQHHAEYLDLGALRPLKRHHAHYSMTGQDNACQEVVTAPLTAVDHRTLQGTG
jgi:hypothetical protein